MCDFSNEGLAEAIDNFMDPDHPDYDPDFVEQLFRRHPEWFTNVEMVEFMLRMPFPDAKS